MNLEELYTNLKEFYFLDDITEEFKTFQSFKQFMEEETNRRKIISEIKEDVCNRHIINTENEIMEANHIFHAINRIYGDDIEILDKHSIRINTNQFERVISYDTANKLSKWLYGENINHFLNTRTTDCDTIVVSVLDADEIKNVHFPLIESKELFSFIVNQIELSDINIEKEWINLNKDNDNPCIGEMKVGDFLIELLNITDTKVGLEFLSVDNNDKQGEYWLKDSQDRDVPVQCYYYDEIEIDSNDNEETVIKKVNLLTRTLCSESQMMMEHCFETEDIYAKIEDYHNAHIQEKEQQLEEI